jgi:hypothetical protein
MKKLGLGGWLASLAADVDAVTLGASMAGQSIEPLVAMYQYGRGRL